MWRHEIYKDWQEADARQTLIYLLNDLRNPVANIRGYATLIRQQSENIEGLPVEFSDWLDGLVQAANDLDELLDAFKNPQQKPLE